MFQPTKLRLGLVFGSSLFFSSFHENIINLAPASPILEGRSLGQELLAQVRLGPVLGVWFRIRVGFQYCLARPNAAMNTSSQNVSVFLTLVYM